MKTIREIIVELRVELKYTGDENIVTVLDQTLRLLEYITDHICVGREHEPVADEEITWEDDLKTPAHR